ncbi:hypothetical protein I545_0997 [Mycobacterium kansasii 662]|uniref:Uncharacterized protein n=2 Tax=Mycobacterium kansasii TaxID=1768 RepID=A0A1V3XXE6_MYCKA|nr:hypothetical protein I545_0997 [Mycobacterium kansasii 662]OOK83947.1 hypothetical protein BZL29_1222 [Mycobacterium kansasii]
MAVHVHAVTWLRTPTRRAGMSRHNTRGAVVGTPAGATNTLRVGSVRLGRECEI